MIFGTTNGNTVQYYKYRNTTTDTPQGTQKFFIPTTLKEVVLTNTTSIWFGAFSNCVNIEKITIPVGYTAYGRAFYNCPAQIIES